MRVGVEQDRAEHRVHAARLARAGGAGDQQMGHLREVRADRAAGHVLAQPHGQRRPVGGLVAHHVAELDDLAVLVGHLDADRGLAGDRRQDADVGGGQRVGEVVLEVGDLAHLHAGRQAHLVAGDVRTGHGADHAGLDAEVAQRLHEGARGLLLARRVRAHLRGGGAGQQPSAGALPHEVGMLGDGVAVAPLGRQVVGPDVEHLLDLLLGLGLVARDRLDRPVRLGRIVEQGLGLAEDRRCAGLTGLVEERAFLDRVGDRLLLVLEDIAEALLQVLDRALPPARDARLVICGLGHGDAAAARRRRLGRPQRTRRVGHLRMGRLEHAGHRGAGEQQHRGQEQEQRDDVAADAAQQRVGDPVQRLPQRAAALLEPVGLPGDLRAAGAEPERARGQRQGQRGRAGTGRRSETGARPAGRGAGSPGRRRPAAPAAPGSGPCPRSAPGRRRAPRRRGRPASRPTAGRRGRCPGRRAPGR